MMGNDRTILDSGKLLAQSFIQEKRAMSLAELRAAAEPGNIPPAHELVSRARALAPKLRERAVQAERDRNIARESVAEYLASGLIHTLQPKRWGGYEHDHEVAFDIAIELGKSTCGSSAWCLNYFSDHACIWRISRRRRSTMSGAETMLPVSLRRRRRPERSLWRPEVIGWTAPGRGAAGCIIRNGS